MANSRTIRNLFFAAVTLFLAIVTVLLLAGAAFIAYKVFEEPGHAEFKAGKAAYRAGNYK